MSDDDLLHVIDHGAVRHLVLNRPGARNALNARLMDALMAALEEAGRTPGVRSVLLRGNGAGFCAGADLKETAALADAASIRSHADRLGRLLLAPSGLGKPVVAQVHGFALGAGCALALACDVVIAAGDARFGYPEIRHGMLPALVVPGLVQRLGRARAFDLLTSARVFDGREAAALGLAHLAEDVGMAAETRAAELAAAPDGLIGRVKALIDAVEGVPLESGMKRAADANVGARLERLAAQEGASHG
ncbi:MAG: enoyl-CoA hydratase/isomerase family protein [Rhizobiales bacterium]|nr:enoyl-CoA hydratase/isomerase family protein [Hyphomicrobiales bacterium]